MVVPMVVPLVAGARAIGAISFVMAESNRRYTATDLEVAEDLGRRAGAAVENARLYRESQDASRLKDEFVTTVSHELRAPLTAILGWARLLAGKSLPPAKQERAVATIERAAVAQAQLIDDLLDMSRIISGKLRLHSSRALGQQDGPGPTPPGSNVTSQETRSWGSRRGIDIPLHSSRALGQQDEPGPTPPGSIVRWRRRESNPGPKALPPVSLHA